MNATVGLVLEIDVDSNTGPVTDGASQLGVDGTAFEDVFFLIFGSYCVQGEIEPYISDGSFDGIAEVLNDIIEEAKNNVDIGALTLTIKVPTLRV